MDIIRQSYALSSEKSARLRSISRLGILVDPSHHAVGGNPTGIHWPILGRQQSSFKFKCLTVLLTACPEQRIDSPDYICAARPYAILI